MRRRTLLASTALPLLAAGRAGPAGATAAPAAGTETAGTGTTPAPRPLAVPLHDVNVIGARVTGSTLYGVTDGTPAMLSAVDAATGQTLFTLPLAGGDGSYTVVEAADGAIYTGSYGNAHLFRVDPAARTITDLGQPLADQTFLWDLAPAPDGRLFGVTYPGARLFAYDPASGAVRDYGRITADTPQARTVAFSDGRVYVGTMEPAHLFEVDPDSGSLSELPLPPGTGDPVGLQAFDVNVLQGRLYLRLGTDIKHSPLHVLDLATRRWIGSLDGVAGLELPEPGPDGRLYVMVAGELLAWDPPSGQTSSTGLTYPGRVYNYRGAGWVDLGDPQWPGKTLTGWFWRGEMWRYNPATGASSVTAAATLPGEPIPVISMSTARDGTALVGGFLGGFARVHPGDGTVEFERFSQTERLLDDGTDIWIGAYPDARGYRYDPSRTWSSPEYSPGPDGTPDNPVKAWDLIGNPDPQDRILSLARAGRYLVGGTGPKGPTFGGLLAVYDTVTDRVRFTASALGDCAASSLAALGGTVFVGGWNHGGTGSGDPPAAEATVFAYDPGEDSVRWQTRPVPGATAYPAMVATGSGDLWVVGDGTPVQLAPGNGRVLRSLRLGDPATTGGPWPAALAIVQEVPGQPALYVKAAGRLWWVWTDALEALDLGLPDYELLTALPGGDLVLSKAEQLYLWSLADHRKSMPRGSRVTASAVPPGTRPAVRADSAGSHGPMTHARN